MWNFGALEFAMSVQLTIEQYEKCGICHFEKKYVVYICKADVKLYDIIITLFVSEARSSIIYQL